jgi:hypothetical protein
VPNHPLVQTVGATDVQVFVANRDLDPMFRPHYSYLFAGPIPWAEVKICPYWAHRFLSQHHESFAADVQVFLGRTNALLQISSTFVMAELHGNSRHDPARPDADVRTPPPRPGDG